MVIDAARAERLLVSANYHILTDAQQVELAALVSIAKSLEAIAEILETKIYPAISEGV